MNNVNRFLLLLLSISIFFACKNPKTNNNYPDKLVIGFFGGDEPEQRGRCFNLLAHYIENQTGVKKVEIYETSDYVSIIEAMRAKKVDIAHFGELAYIMAANRANARAIVVLAKKDGSCFAKSIIVASSKSQIKSIEDVKKRAKELTISFADPASTSGHLYPRHYLNSIGLDPEKSFKSVVFSNSHGATVLTVLSGKVDLACVSATTIHLLVVMKKIKPDDIVILWTSQPYIAVPVSVRSDLPPRLIEKIQKAYLDLPTKDAFIWSSFKKTLFKGYPDSIINQFVYMPACDSQYNVIRRMVRQSKNFEFFKLIL